MLQKINTKENYVKIIIIILIGIFISCNSSEDFSDENLEEIITETSPYKIDNNTSTLSERITYINRTATITPLVTGVNARSLGKISSNVNGTQEQYYWEHVAEVAPLNLSGETLSATHITLSNNKAYVSYHKQGNIHLGAVEIIDLSNPNFPAIISQASFFNSDINAVTSGYTDNSSFLKVWLAMSDAAHGAQLYELEADTGLFTENFRRVNLSNIYENSGVSASANGIAITDNYLYVTSGKTHGGTIQLNKNNLSAIASETYSNAKYVAVNGASNNSKVVSLITGEDAQIRVDNVNENLNSTSYSIGSIWHQNVAETYRGKSTMEFSPINNNQLYIAKGKDGIALVDVTSGEITNESKGTMLVVGNTNGVSTDNDYIYAANGSDGISISPHPTNNGEDILPVFYWDMAEEGASANYIVADGEWVFIAKGGGGFKILRKRIKDEYKTITTYNNQGKPDGLEEDKEVCSTLLPNIYANVLPERQNAMTAHPEYFANPVKNLVIKEETDLYLTFIDEGAGYKNVLGYYTYQEGNKPTSSDQIDKIVIFPNASAERSGGELVRGNTMRLLGSFEPGTVVSFFLIANGWRNGSITDGYYSQHTDIDYNLSGRQQSIIFYDVTCNSTVIAFEDINVPNGDNDFNDAIFEITASNPNALETATFNQIGN
ncbi:hypothetical protein WH52_09485 [Tenacibaculum holothuriorum]|uniref:DUF4114 domain-containing protein n=1 Tax=Tenacibaculum holothuriorum TaxID=1635173 RepID=A0A1Y2PBV7_9FLAO|nr:DUF4114 domain-containing protein [Tenacibaculum holothuriorum]OSY87660.1 hypothetical protein WH52_09485 [Tenacibaculum holothuriorum]